MPWRVLFEMSRFVRSFIVPRRIAGWWMLGRVVIWLLERLRVIRAGKVSRSVVVADIATRSRTVIGPNNFVFVKSRVFNFWKVEKV